MDIILNRYYFKRKGLLQKYNFATILSMLDVIQLCFKGTVTLTFFMSYIRLGKENFMLLTMNEQI